MVEYVLDGFDFINNIRDWYNAEFPDDEQGDLINPEATFSELCSCVAAHKDAFKLVGDTLDNLTFSRIFARYYELCGANYDYCSNKHMINARKYKIE